MVLSILPHCLIFTSGRPRLAALHVATLVYGVIIEIFGFWCPLTALEEWLHVRGGVSAYRGPFLLHYLDAVVYPNIPMTTAGSLVFFGDDNESFEAVDAWSGVPLWRFNTGQEIHASPMSYAVNGNQYVSIAAGGNVFSFGLP
jgi:hypothetical protein